MRVILGFALALTAVWLLNVLVALLGMRATVIVAVLMLAIVAGLALKSRLPENLRWVAAPVIALLVLVAASLPALGPGPLARGGAEESGRIAWQPFERAKIRGLVAQGKTVLVDVTADWCVTCQANKRLVIDRAPVVDRLVGVTSMKADWTRPDPVIAAYLAEHGKYGIPFNVVYGPGAPTGVVLPELLTPDAVVSALDKAGGEGSSAAQALRALPVASGEQSVDTRMRPAGMAPAGLSFDLVQASGGNRLQRLALGLDAERSDTRGRRRDEAAGPEREHPAVAERRQHHADDVGADQRADAADRRGAARAGRARPGRVELGRVGVEHRPHAEQEELHHQPEHDQHREGRRVAVEEGRDRRADQHQRAGALAAPGLHQPGRGDEARNARERDQHV